MAVSVSDVEALDSQGWQQFDQAKKQALLEDARAERDTIFTEQVATLPTLDGDVDVFTKNLTAHKWELANGGEAQSESGTGGSVNYTFVNADQVSEYLSQTRFGRTARQHLRDEQGIGIVTTH